VAGGGGMELELRSRMSGCVWYCDSNGYMLDGGYLVTPSDTDTTLSSAPRSAGFKEGDDVLVDVSISDGKVQVRFGKRSFAPVSKASTKRGVAGVEDEAPDAAQAAGSVAATSAGIVAPNVPPPPSKAPLSKAAQARARLTEFEKSFNADVRAHVTAPPAPPAERAPNLGVYAALEGVRYMPETILGECHSSHGEEFFVAMQSSSSFDSVAVLLDEEMSQDEEIAETRMSQGSAQTHAMRAPTHAMHGPTHGMQHMALPPCPPLFLSAPKVAKAARQMERRV
jgi:hypothetical protein